MVTQDIKIKEKNLKKYGLSLIDYQKLLKEQGRRCALCFRQPGIFKYDLGVDHDHETGKVRGLLCNACNQLLTQYRDINFFKRIVAYLEKCYN